MNLTKNDKIKIGLGIGIIALTAITLNYLLKNVRKLIGLKFDYKGTKVNAINFKEISLTLNWLIENPSDLSFTVKNQVYDVYINNIFVRKVGSSDNVKVLSRGTSILPTNVYITTKEALMLGTENLAGFITESGRKRTRLKIVGTFDISTPLFTLRKFPFYFEDSIQNIMNY